VHVDDPIAFWTNHSRQIYFMLEAAPVSNTYRARATSTPAKRLRGAETADCGVCEQVLVHVQNITSDINKVTYKIQQSFFHAQF
jgi:hypothetical protein